MVQAVSSPIMGKGVLAMTALGAVANLKVKDHKTLDNPVMHRIPSLMMVERFRVEMMHDLQKRGPKR